jgi:hypothetical protein
MTYRGYVKSGQIVLDAAVKLPEGSEVNVELITSRENPPDDDLAAVLRRHAGKGKNLPADLAANHDHYAHGKPKL